MQSRASRGRMWAVAVALLLLATVLSAGSSVASRSVPSASHASTPSTLSVTANAPYKFIPNSFGNVNTGTSVVVTFTDADVQAHSFTITGREGWQIPVGYSNDQLAAYLKQYPPLLSLLANNTGTFTGNFTSPATAGWYEFVCNQPGHYQEGMYGFIAFGMAVPANLTVSTPSTAPGQAVFIISGTIVALVVIAIVLGFVIGRRRGAVHEMPPERLGYPEPPTAPVQPPPPPRPPNPPG